MHVSFAPYSSCSVFKVLTSYSTPGVSLDTFGVSGLNNWRVIGKPGPLWLVDGVDHRYLAFRLRTAGRFSLERR